jgi:oxygen-dependent protoporphyrinogen oxidase
VLLRVLLGGERHREDATLSDEALSDITLRELRPILRMRRDATPQLYHAVRHWPGLPQYEVGHLERVRAIEERRGFLPRIFLTGNSYRALSVSKVVAEAEALATKMIALRAAA